MALIHFLTIAVLIHSKRAGCQENSIFLRFTPEVKTLPSMPELINHISFFLFLLNSEDSLLQKDKKRVFAGPRAASWGRDVEKVPAASHNHVLGRAGLQLCLALKRKTQHLLTLDWKVSSYGCNALIHSIKYSHIKHTENKAFLKWQGVNSIAASPALHGSL